MLINILVATAVVAVICFVDFSVFFMDENTEKLLYFDTSAEGVAGLEGTNGGEYRSESEADMDCHEQQTADIQEIYLDPSVDVNDMMPDDVYIGELADMLVNDVIGKQ